MAGARKAKFKVGQVVATRSIEQRVMRIADLCRLGSSKRGPFEYRMWHTDEWYPERMLRALTAKEKGHD